MAMRSGVATGTMVQLKAFFAWLLCKLGVHRWDYEGYPTDMTGNATEGQRVQFCSRCSETRFR